MVRAEYYARWIEASFQISLDSGEELPKVWETILLSSSDAELYYQEYEKLEFHSLISFFTMNDKNPNSLYSCIYRARENARSIRETLPAESWEIINDIYLYFIDMDPKELKSEGFIRKLNERVRNSSLALFGSNESFLLHDAVKYFGIMGRSMEKADKITRFIDREEFVSTGSAGTIQEGRSVLKSLGSQDMYLRYHSEFSRERVFQFLIFFEESPGSFLYQINQMIRCLEIMENNPEEPKMALKLTKEFFSQVKKMNYNDIVKNGIHKTLDWMQLQLNIIGNSLNKSYFQV
jgi:uncharacterized alpha-E superfamily protein